jgi:hypothetical protein
MKKFRFSFIGRQAGAIGIFHKIVDSYKCKDIHEAMSYLYEDYEHIFQLKCVCDSKEIELPKNINFVKVRSNKLRQRNPTKGSYLYTRNDTVNL